MSVDVQAETRSAERRPMPARQAAVASYPAAPTAPWLKRLVIALAVIAVVGATAMALIRSVTPENVTQVLTHTITRSDLAVSVTEQGTMESSSNREIKCKVKGGSTVLWVIESGTEVKPGDELVRLDTSAIEDRISQQRIVYETAQATKATAENDVAVAQISVTEYLEGTYRSEQALKAKDVVISESNLKSAINARDHAARMFRKGYISRLELDTHEDSVKHAELEVTVKKTDLEVLEKFTKAKTLQEFESLLDVAEARLASATAALDLEMARLTREQQQLENCVITADVGGMVIFPSAAEWKEQPDIEEGATVREDQVLLIIPDLKQMQVKIGIHEAKVDRVKPGMKAQVQLPHSSVMGTVHSIASVTKPTGWWNGNVVKYDTVIKLDGQQEGLKPGMSVAVEVFLARHDDVLTIPVAAVVEQGGQYWCWVETEAGVVKRPLQLGDSNDRFIVVESGVVEGERVALNPLDFVEEAQRGALKPGGPRLPTEEGADASAAEDGAGASTPGEAAEGKPAAADDKPAQQQKPDSATGEAKPKKPQPTEKPQTPASSQP